ncbi:MAG TPA: SGNH/GDSL hydrolase family protein, partial [Metabacillus sp.]|nr:SGNH/GDSL hydrolase family protein [Metabacillus sp.]
GGNRITDLASRWQKDVIEPNPDYVSISIGINDVWRQLDRPEIEQVDVEKFERIYKELLTQVKEHTNARIILMEPTVIEEDLQAQGNQMLKKYVKVVNEMAKQFEAIIVPTHQAFIQYLENNNGYKLTTDGVHMNSAGNMLMATTWLKVVEDQLK